MKSMLLLLTVAALLAGPHANAQDSALLGKYTGNYQFSGRGVVTTVTITLDVQNVQNGEITGIATRYAAVRGGGMCTGEFQVAGRLKGNALSVRSTEKGGTTGDCTFAMTGVFEGGKLLAKLGQNEFEMTK